MVFSFILSTKYYGSIDDNAPTDMSMYPKKHTIPKAKNPSLDLLLFAGNKPHAYSLCENG